jgi:hypothetical protein
VALDAEWRMIGAEHMTKDKLRTIYKKVYKTRPEWLEAIEDYLR